MASELIVVVVVEASVDRLRAIADALGMAADELANVPPESLSPPYVAESVRFLADPLSHQTIFAWFRIEDPSRREALLDIIKEFAGGVS